MSLRAYRLSGRFTFLKSPTCIRLGWSTIKCRWLSLLSRYCSRSNDTFFLWKPKKCAFSKEPFQQIYSSRSRDRVTLLMLNSVDFSQAIYKGDTLDFELLNFHLILADFNPSHGLSSSSGPLPCFWEYRAFPTSLTWQGLEQFSEMSQLSFDKCTMHFRRYQKLLSLFAIIWRN